MKQFLKRRFKLLILALIFFGLLGTATLYLLDPIFESSITIQVQDDETIDPLTFYGIAGSNKPENRLEAFDKIVFSRTSIEKLVDSLGLGLSSRTELETRALVDSLREKISTKFNQSDLFEITYQSNKADKARDGVRLLANHLIQTRLRLEEKRNRETVKFFENKIKQLESIVDNPQKSQEVETVPRQATVNSGVLQTRLQNIDNKLMGLEWDVISQENRLKKLRNFLSLDDQNFSIKTLYSLSLDEVSLGANIIDLLEEYEQMSQQFTENYPPFKSLKKQIVEAVQRIVPAIESNLASLKIQQESLNQQRMDVINDMELAFVAAQSQSSDQSDVSIYQELYDDMKIKLEQARISYKIGDEITERFTVAEEPSIAENPIFPDRKFIISISLISGVVFGVAFMVMAEMMDTTIRSEKDLKLNKPVIAFLSDGKK